MKKLLLLVLIPVLWGCKDDIGFFDVQIPPENISFRAIAGGAVMHYKLPADKEINSINVRYSDAFGDDILCSGSYACDSVTLWGFNEAQHGVRALVTLCDRNNVESTPVEVFFDTKDSAPVAFFDNVEISPGWDGFIVTYDAPENARGIAHIFYVGENPLTSEPDTILVKSFPIKAGMETISIRQQQKRSMNDVVIRTEDFRGYMVKQQVWQGVKTLESVKLEYPVFDFEDPEGLSIEDPFWYLGYEYLFDGNTKGHFGWTADEFRFYFAGPQILDRTLFIIDFHGPKIVASIRFYAMLNIDRGFYYGSDFPYYSAFSYYLYLYQMLPCHLTVYASNDNNSWIEIGSFEEGSRTTMESRWCYRARGAGSYYYSDKEEFEAAEPCFLEISVPPRESFRYLKVVFHKLYEDEDGSYNNAGNYACMQELEIYTAKD